VFVQTVGFGFVNIDDDKYVYNTPQISHGLSSAGIVWAFTHSHATNWHPLTWISLMLDCQLYGLHPGGHHLTNVLLHAAAAVLLFFVLWQMTGHLWPSALVAALFAIHPLRAESVAWVTERKDVLSGLLFMLTLGAYLGYVRHQFSLVRYLAVLVFFALGLMAKPMLVTLPLVLLLLDYWPLGRLSDSRRLAPTPPHCNGGENPGGVNVTEPAFGPLSFPRHLLVEKIPLVALVAVSCLATLWAQQEAMISEDRLPFSARVANALVSYVAYLDQFFYPRGLALFYPHPGTHLPIWKVVGAGVVLACISAAVLRHRRRRPYLLVGWLWYLGMLVPAIGLKQVAGQAMADRYTYLPQIGLGISLAWWAADSCRGWPYRRAMWSLASAVALAALIGWAWRQTSFWCDSETLWNRTLACTSYNKVAHNGLAADLAAQGRLDEAMGHYRDSLGISPNDAEAINSLGVLLARVGRFDEAMACYRQSEEIKPGYAHAYYNLGNLLAERGRFDEAFAQLQRAVEVNPDFGKAHRGLGIVLAARGRPIEALGHFQKAIEINPDDAEAHRNLGHLLVGAGQSDEATSHFRKALEIQPEDAEAHRNLGVALANCGQFDEAMVQFEQARKIKPDDAGVLGSLATALAAQGRFAEAMGHYRMALKLQPEDLAAQKNLAWLRATCPETSLRNGAEAIELAQRANNRCGGRRPDVLDTLAAAYAESGWFPEALATARKALELAIQQNERALADTVRARIALYEAGKPYHQTSLPSHGPKTK
jgi:tetratricopeptide (TPR) repeat protein